MMDISVLQNEVLTNIDIGEDSIRFTTKSGKIYQLHHHQDCCESVYITNISGSFQQLVGKVIRLVEEEINSSDDNDEELAHDSWTKTKYTFKTDDDTVICRWIGESNGYYSEHVDFDHIGYNDEYYLMHSIDGPVTGLDWLVAADEWEMMNNMINRDYCKSKAREMGYE